VTLWAGNPPNRDQMFPRNDANAKLKLKASAKIPAPHEMMGPGGVTPKKRSATDSAETPAQKRRRLQDAAGTNLDDNGFTFDTPPSATSFASRRAQAANGQPSLILRLPQRRPDFTLADKDALTKRDGAPKAKFWTETFLNVMAARNAKFYNDEASMSEASSTTHLQERRVRENRFREGVLRQWATEFGFQKGPTPSEMKKYLYTKPADSTLNDQGVAATPVIEPLTRQRMEYVAGVVNKDMREKQKAREAREAAQTGEVSDEDSFEA
jgi:hypothetical protein